MVSVEVSKTGGKTAIFEDTLSNLHLNYVKVDQNIPSQLHNEERQKKKVQSVTFYRVKFQKNFLADEHQVR